MIQEEFQTSSRIGFPDMRQQMDIFSEFILPKSGRVHINHGGNVSLDPPRLGASS